MHFTASYNRTTDEMKNESSRFDEDFYMSQVLVNHIKKHDRTKYM